MLKDTIFYHYLDTKFVSIKIWLEAQYIESRISGSLPLFLLYFRLVTFG